MHADAGRLHSILFVEDVAETRRGMERLLKPLGYRVASVADAESAVCAAHKRAPDLILIDLGMPSRDVLAIGRDIRERAALDGVPVVVIAAEYDVEAENQQAGAGDYIAHLADFEQLESLLERIFAAEKPAVAEQTTRSFAAAIAPCAAGD